MISESLFGIPGMTPGGVGIWTLVAFVIVAFFRVWPAMKKASNENSDSLRHDLMALLETERAAWTQREIALREEISTLKTDNAQLHGQIHELRNQMLELMLAAGRAGTPRTQAAARKKMQAREGETK